jgi:hypothetical protein
MSVHVGNAGTFRVWIGTDSALRADALQPLSLDEPLELKLIASVEHSHSHAKVTFAFDFADELHRSLSAIPIVPEWEFRNCRMEFATIGDTMRIVEGPAQIRNASWTRKPEEVVTATTTFMFLPGATRR